MATKLTAGMDRLGTILLRQKLVTEEQLNEALQDAQTHGTRLGYSLIRLGMIEEDQLTQVLSRQYRVQAIDINQVQIDPRLLRLVPEDLAHGQLVLPVRRMGRTLTVAMANPADPGTLDQLKFVTRHDIEPVVVGEFTLKKAIDRYYGPEFQDALDDLLDEIDVDDIEVIEQEEEEVGEATLQAQVQDAPIVKLINGILTDAVRRGVSDIHIEPYEKQLRIRYRIDGALKEVMKPPVRMKAALTSRVKILADLNIAERRVPQDGRIKMKVRNRVIDFRVSTLPVIFGEKIVLRILDKGTQKLDLSQFGFEPKAEKDFMRAIAQPYGMVLVTGPTGSGKTTTLYSALSKINTEDVNIMTAEDPVEYNLHGINQVQVRSEIGMTFAAALRAFLRQDPNIVMVGEIRDLETGGIAIKAALTGHLVFSTLHTNDAPSTIVRMIDMGLEPFNVAAALNVITAQRLVRRICKNCREEVRYPDEYLDAAGLSDEEKAVTYFRGRGCEECSETGYKGRQGLYEVMAATPSIRKLIMDDAGADELKAQALREGMLTLHMDGLKKAARGITTLEEVIKETTV